MAGDPSWNSVGLLLHLDGAAGATSFVDTGPSARAITPFGSAKISAVQSVFGDTSAFLDGSDMCFLEMENASVFSPSAKDWTIELLFFPTLSTATSLRVLASKRAINVTPANEWSLSINTTGTLAFVGWDATNTACINIASTSSVVFNAWNRAAVTREASTKKWRIFLNNDAPVSGVETANVVTTTIKPAIGRDSRDTSNSTNPPGTPARNYGGYIDELRITDGVCRYTTTFSAPTSPYPDGAGQVTGTVTASGSPAARVVRAIRRADGALLKEIYTGPGESGYDSVSLLLSFEGADGSKVIVDRSRSPKAITVSGNVQIKTDQSKFGTSAGYFPGGAGDFLTVKNSLDLDPLASDFTIEGFVRFASTAVAQGIFAGHANSSGFAPYLILFSGGNLLFYSSSAGAAWDVASAQVIKASVVAGTWYHFAVCRSGSTIRLFVDGVLTTSITFAGSLLSIGTNTPTVGQWAQANYFNGHMQALRFTKGIARYTAPFTPPSARFAERTVGNLGDYSFYAPTLDELSVLCLDDVAGITENDLVRRVFPA